MIGVDVSPREVGGQMRIGHLGEPVKFHVAVLSANIPIVQDDCSMFSPTALRLSRPAARDFQGSALSMGEQPLDFEVEHSRRIQPENPRALIFVESAHLPLDCLGGMRP